MENFVKFGKRRNRSGNVDKSNTDKFVGAFNKAIKRTGCKDYTLNTGLDDIPQLTDEEYALVGEQARKNGYWLTRYNDNYNTQTYRLSLAE